MKGEKERLRERQKEGDSESESESESVGESASERESAIVCVCERASERERERLLGVVALRRDLILLIRVHLLAGLEMRDPRKALRGGIQTSILTDCSGECGRFSPNVGKNVHERPPDTPTKGLLW